jgi:hypothetical protein
MSKIERLKKNVLWLIQGFITACIVLGFAFGGIAAYESLFGSAENPVRYTAEAMFSGFVLAILLAATLIPTLLSSLSNEAGVLRALGAGLGLLVVMEMISETLPPT